MLIHGTTQDLDNGSCLSWMNDNAKRIPFLAKFLLYKCQRPLVSIVCSQLKRGITVALQFLFLKNCRCHMTNPGNSECFFLVLVKWTHHFLHTPCAPTVPTNRRNDVSYRSVDHLVSWSRPVKKWSWSTSIHKAVQKTTFPFSSLSIMIDRDDNTWIQFFLWRFSPSRIHTYSSQCHERFSKITE